MAGNNAATLLQGKHEVLQSTSTARVTAICGHLQPQQYADQSFTPFHIAAPLPPSKHTNRQMSSSTLRLLEGEQSLGES